MSQPNDPDKNSTPAGPGPSKGPVPDGPGRSGALVPPWQRGPGENAPGPKSGPGAMTEQINGGPRPGPPRPGGPGPGGPVPGGPGPGGPVPVPVTQLSTPHGPAGPAVAAPDGPKKFVESPTRTISRDDSVAPQLPDLDEIHHTQSAVPRTASATTEQASRPGPTQVAAGSGLRAAVQVRRFDPWAVFKVSGVLAIIGFIIWMIAVAVLYLVLDGMGVWEQLNNASSTLITTDGAASEGDIIGAGTVFLYAGIIGAINSVLMTALATIGAYIYNLVADLVGGVEITIADLD
ncbi:MAG: DUF3566 domain-containing protein [Gordonia sp. (in: high G+C Gram-positive bacteria)]